MISWWWQTSLQEEHMENTAADQLTWRCFWLKHWGWHDSSWAFEIIMWYFINITAQAFSDRFCFSLVIPSINLCPNSSMHQDLEIWHQGLGKPQGFKQKRRTVRLQEDLQTLDISCSKQYHIFLQHRLPSCALLMLWQHFQFSHRLSWFLLS